jgi:hypothetical protein
MDAVRCSSMHRVAVLSANLIGLLASSPATAFAEPRARGTAPARRVAIAAGHEVAPVVPVEPAPADPLAIDVPKLRRHAETIAKLVGQPAGELAATLGAAATIGDDSIEWNLADAGVAAATAYGYASIVDGTVTGFVIRGRAPLDQLRQLHLHRPLQLTRAGGERPAYSIAVGE